MKTATPWASQGKQIHSLQFDEPLDSRNLVATVDGEANAAYIVKAVNSHEGMIAALKESNARINEIIAQRYNISTNVREHLDNILVAIDDALKLAGEE